MDLDRNCRLGFLYETVLGLLRNFPAVILASSKKGLCGSTLWIFQLGTLAQKLDPGEDSLYKQEGFFSTGVSM